LEANLGEDLPGDLKSKMLAVRTALQAYASAGQAVLAALGGTQTCWTLTSLIALVIKGPVQCL
jgi:hypothetical protein